MVDGTMPGEALHLVSSDRNESYGPPEENLRRIAEFWSSYLRVTVTSEDVANMMALVKISRAKATYKRDNYLDGIGYLLLADSLGRHDHGR